jgi:translation initiation factor 1
MMFEIGAKFDDGWESDNRRRSEKPGDGTIIPPERHRLWINRERRRGKRVTLCGPFTLSSDERKALLKMIKKELGTGGAWKKEVLVVQGDRPDALKALLERHKFRFKHPD